MTRKFILFELILAFLGGCQATHLVYVHDASLGIDVSASTEGTGRIAFGYDRDTFALVPRAVGQDTSDAMSLTAVSCVYADGLNKIEFDHFVSTGEAAKAVAADAEGLKKIRAAIYGKGDNQQCD